MNILPSWYWVTVVVIDFARRGEAARRSHSQKNVIIFVRTLCTLLGACRKRTPKLESWMNSFQWRTNKSQCDYEKPGKAITLTTTDGRITLSPPVAVAIYTTYVNLPMIQAFSLTWPTFYSSRFELSIMNVLYSKRLNPWKRRIYIPPPYGVSKIKNQAHLSWPHSLLRVNTLLDNEGR